MKKLSAFLMTSVLIMQASVASAQNMSPIEIINKVNQNRGLSFTGSKTQKVVRQQLKLESKASVDFVDPNNFNITVDSPTGISGIRFAVNSGRSTIYFPYEKLSFTDAPATSGSMITETVIGRITSDSSLLQKNYSIEMKADDEIASNPTYVISIKPKAVAENKFWMTPGRTFWINKSNFQILREDRTWGDNIDPFFSSQFTNYKSVGYVESPNVRLKLPYNVKKVPLGDRKDKIETYMESYKTPEDLEKKTKEKIALPTYLPNGFKLREIQVLNFYDTRIMLQRYDDGLNTMYVSYRSKPNFFLTLLAGSFSLNLLHKMSDLSYNAPYNYITKQTDQNLIISFGDLFPNELEKVNNSVAVK